MLCLKQKEVILSTSWEMIEAHNTVPMTYFLIYLITQPVFIEII